jgi:hypothetical protein
MIMNKLRVTIGYKILSEYHNTLTVAVTMDNKVIDIIAGPSDVLKDKLSNIFNQ